ncbi:MAG TPA: hypothetical protein VF627_06910, partial [Abditibacterium sp.]
TVRKKEGLLLSERFGLEHLAFYLVSPNRAEKVKTKGKVSQILLPSATTVKATVVARKFRKAAPFHSIEYA